MLVSMEEKSILVGLLLDIGEEMYTAGAEISRVEDTLQRIGLAYGARYVDAFALTSGIILSVRFEDNGKHTQLRRIRRPEADDFSKIELLNELSRDCVAGKLSLEQLHDRVRKLQKEAPRGWKLLLGYCIASAAFAVFFGGNLADALVSGLFGAGLYLLDTRLSPYCASRLLYRFMISLLCGLMICGICRLIPSLHQEMIIIGDIMLLIPGIGFTNSVRNIVIGDTISGMEKTVEAALLAVAVAAGFGLAVIL